MYNNEIKNADPVGNKNLTIKYLDIDFNNEIEDLAKEKVGQKEKVHDVALAILGILALVTIIGVPFYIYLIHRESSIQVKSEEDLDRANATKDFVITTIDYLIQQNPQPEFV